MCVEDFSGTPSRKTVVCLFPSFSRLSSFPPTYSVQTCTIGNEDTCKKTGYESGSVWFNVPLDTLFVSDRDPILFSFYAKHWSTRSETLLSVTLLWGKISTLLTPNLRNSLNGFQRFSSVSVKLWSWTHELVRHTMMDICSQQLMPVTDCYDSKNKRHPGNWSTDMPVPKRNRHTTLGETELTL